MCEIKNDSRFVTEFVTRTEFLPYSMTESVECLPNGFSAEIMLNYVQCNK